MTTAPRIMLVLVAFVPSAAGAQRTVDLATLGPHLLAGSVCDLRAPLTGRVWDTVLPPWDRDGDRLLRALEEVRDSLDAEAVARPSDVDVLHELAVTLGTLTELQGASSKVRTAQELSGVADRILEIDPDHAGAHHVLGRLHAAMMRLGRLERFVATRCSAARHSRPPRGNPHAATSKLRSRVTRAASTTTTSSRGSTPSVVTRKAHAPRCGSCSASRR